MQLRLIRQIDGSRFDGSNCGCVATAHAIAWSTQGAVVPTPDDCRQALKGTWVGLDSSPPNNSTSLSDQSRAWLSFSKAVADKGLDLPAFTIRRLTPWADVIQALENHRAVMLQIDHATINDKAMQLSGFPTFRGLHVVLITRIRQGPAGRELLDYDGGFDGRTTPEGIRVPRGPQWLPEDVLRLAAQRKNVISLQASGTPEDEAKQLAKGTATFAVIRRAQPIDPGPEKDKQKDKQKDKERDKEKVEPVEPVPDPSVEQLKAELAAVQAALAVATTVNESLADDNVKLENALGIIRTLLIDAGAANSTLAAAAADIDEVLVPPVDGGFVMDDGVGSD